jgi:hypothetical protein
MVKILRFIRGWGVFNIEKIMGFFKSVFRDHLDARIRENPRIGESTKYDYNQLEALLYIKFFFRMLKLVTAIFTMSFFLG